MLTRGEVFVICRRVRFLFPCFSNRSYRILVHFSGPAGCYVCSLLIARQVDLNSTLCFNNVYLYLYLSSVLVALVQVFCLYVMSCTHVYFLHFFLWLLIRELATDKNACNLTLLPCKYKSNICIHN